MDCLDSRNVAKPQVLSGQPAFKTFKQARARFKQGHDCQDKGKGRPLAAAVALVEEEEKEDAVAAAAAAVVSPLAHGAAPLDLPEKLSKEVRALAQSMLGATAQVGPTASWASLRRQFLALPDAHLHVLLKKTQAREGMTSKEEWVDHFFVDDGTAPVKAFHGQA